MTLPANLNVYISVLLFVVGAYVAALYVGLIVWTFRDMHSRSKDMLGQILATLLVAVFTLPGLIIYLLLRPHTTLAEEYDRNLTEEAILQDLEERRVCPNCHHRVDPDYIVCPYCHHQLRLRCVGCGRLLQPNWEVCPYCGLYRDQPGEPHEDMDNASASGSIKPIEDAATETLESPADLEDTAVIAPFADDTIEGTDSTQDDVESTFADAPKDEPSPMTEDTPPQS